MGFLIYTVIAVLIYILYKWLTKNLDYFERKGVKYSKGIPILGSAESLFRSKKSFPDACTIWYNSFPNEKIYGFFPATAPMYIIKDPQLVKKLCVKDFDFFSDHRVILDESQDKLFGKALIALRGDKWKEMRSTLSPAFTGSKMRQMIELVVKVAKENTMTLKEKIISNNILGEEYEFKDLMSKYTVDNISTCAFGIQVNSFSDPDNEFQRIAKEFSDFSSLKTVFKFMGFLAFPWLMKLLDVAFISKKTQKFFEKAILETIKIREEKNIVRYDMINLLMQAKKGKLKHEVKEENLLVEGFATVEESQIGKAQSTRVWEDIDLAAQCFIFFVAGFDTVSTTMGFMAYELMVNYELQVRLYEEIVTVSNELNGEPITYERIQSMKYMDQVVCEVLRKWPAAPGTDRICVKDYDMDVDGLKFTFDKEKNFFVPIWGFHHDPKYFPNPEKFDPERFNDENKKNIQEYTYMPFGIGPRNCIGSRFALMEIKVVFFYLLLNFSLHKGEKAQVPLKLAPIPVGMKTEKGNWIKLVPRL